MFGHYRLEGLIGRGGMGEVHRAWDTEQDRSVALKMLPAGLSGDEEYRQRFRREARLASRLNDPHVVPIHRHGEIDGRLYLEMRLIEGQNLGTLLAVGGPLSPGDATLMLEQVASALDTAHEAGLVHRDVKPSNVFLTRARPGARRFAYLGDFGIARALVSASSSLTATGATVGTLGYMAPERFLDRPIDARTDVYALACVLHEALTGRPPFPGRDLPALMRCHLDVPPPAPSGTHPGLAAFDAVVARGMAKSPGDRYPTAGELAAAARTAAERAAATHPAHGQHRGGTPPAPTWIPSPARPPAPAARPAAPDAGPGPAAAADRIGLVTVGLGIALWISGWSDFTPYTRIPLAVMAGATVGVGLVAGFLRWLAARRERSWTAPALGGLTTAFLIAYTTAAATSGGEAPLSTTVAGGVLAAVAIAGLVVTGSVADRRRGALIGDGMIGAALALATTGWLWLGNGFFDLPVQLAVTAAGVLVAGAVAAVRARVPGRRPVGAATAFAAVVLPAGMAWMWLWT